MVWNVKNIVNILKLDVILIYICRDLENNTYKKYKDFTMGRMKHFVEIVAYYAISGLKDYNPWEHPIYVYDI